MQEINATVLEVETKNMTKTREALAGRDAILSVAQLGMRLRVLAAPDLENPTKPIEQWLAEGGIDTAVKVVPASLEDVFVVATQSRVEQPEV